MAADLKGPLRCRPTREPVEFTGDTAGFEIAGLPPGIVLACSQQSVLPGRLRCAAPRAPLSFQLTEHAPAGAEEHQVREAGQVVPFLVVVRRVDVRPCDPAFFTEQEYLSL